MDGSEGPDGMLVGHTTWVACESHSSCSSKVQNEPFA